MADRTRKTSRTRSKTARSEPETLEDLAARARSTHEQTTSEALKDEALEDLAARARSTDEQTTSEALKDEALEDLAARATSTDEQTAKRSNPEELVEENRRSLEAVEVNAAIKDGMDALSSEILSFGNNRLNANLEWSQSLVACKDAEQAFRVHTEFFESAVRQYLNQANNVMAIMASMTGGVWAPLEEQTKESLRQREGIAKAKADGKYKGRKPTAHAKASEVLVLREEGIGASEIARRLQIGRASVYRIIGAP